MREPPEEDRSTRTTGPQVDLGAAILLTVVLVFLHLVLMAHIGGLWRDEVNSVNLSTPGVASLTEFNGNDSFPILWFLILRVWIMLFGSASDLALRILGLLIGLAVIGSFWFSNRKLSRDVPLFSLSLFLLNPEFIRRCDSLRAYGLGVVFLLCVVWAFWNLTRSPGRGAFTLAALIGVLAVQSVFYNSFLLLVIAVAASAASLRSRGWKVASLPILAGIPAAASLLPYVPMISSMSYWDALVKVDLTPLVLTAKFLGTLATSGWWVVGAWILLYVLAMIVTALIQAPSFASRVDPDRRDLARFLLIILVLSVPAYLLFLQFLSFPTEPWYYIAICALVALCIDSAFSLISDRRMVRIARIGSVALIVFLSLPHVWPRLHERQTNVDLIANWVEEQAGPGDLVVISPWHDGITFARYYDGLADVTTVPPIGFSRYHRFNLVRPMLLNAGSAIDPVLQDIVGTLRSGSRVWSVGTVWRTEDNHMPEPLPSPPLPDSEWNAMPYNQNWALTVGTLLSRHAQPPLLIDADGDREIDKYEDSRLLVFQGWSPRPLPAPAESQVPVLR